MASVGNSSEGVTLNVMPMLDIFSILILFLLMNFSTDPVSHDLDKSIELASSATIRSLDEVPSATIARKKILVNQLTILEAKDGSVNELSLDQEQLKKLFDSLGKLANVTRSHMKKNENLLLTVEVDKEAKFKVIRTFMKVAQQHEFTRYKLMVAKSL